jgi:hypothetical protein
MKKAKELFIFGVVILAIAAVDLISFIVELCTLDFSIYANEEKLAQTVLKVVTIVCLVISAVSILVSVYLGVKGITESKKPSGGKLHITIAKIIAIFNVVLAVFAAIVLFNSKDLFGDILTLLITIVDVIFMFSYVNAAKAVRGKK